VRYLLGLYALVKYCFEQLLLVDRDSTEDTIQLEMRVWKVRASPCLTLPLPHTRHRLARQVHELHHPLHSILHPTISSLSKRHGKKAR
jgi:hypothetical protein